ncbi:MAG: hypothetical protein MUC48_20315 [Leptolyngbya sp. Prado105]|jgi:hypothetical protein|nr:hypothetical protein [Leptolyngbya sp. Prado105]
MNYKVEKWLTIAALVGWVASIGSLVGLAIRATAPASASRPVVSKVKAIEAQRVLPKSQADAAVPKETSQGY